MNDESSVRVGVVGCGGMGTLHAENVVQFGHEVVGGADVVEANREQFGDEFDATPYADHESLIESEELDAIFVTVPNAFHEPVAVAALEAGIDVLCEKPLADTLEGAESIVETATESDAFCMVGVHNRFSTVASLFDTYRENGTFGDITHVQANYVRRRGIPGVGTWFTDPDLAGGGALIDIGVHALDLALYLLDFPEVLEVSGVARTNFGNRSDYADPDDWGDGSGISESAAFGVDDSASAFIRCANGTTIVLEAAWASNQEPTHEFVARGTDAGARFHLGEKDFTVFSAESDDVDHYVDREIRGNREPNSHAAQDQHFLEAVHSGEAPTTNTVEEGLQVQRILDAIYRSSEQGTAISL